MFEGFLLGFVVRLALTKGQYVEVNDVLDACKVGAAVGLGGLALSVLASVL